jgi:hypothetical protein
MCLLLGQSKAGVKDKQPLTTCVYFRANKGETDQQAKEFF